jgi:hypothetical protein
VDGADSPGGLVRSRGDAASQFYLPFGEWRALRHPGGRPRPRLIPLWIASLIGAWAATNPRTRVARRWIAMFAAMAVLNVAIYWVFIPYRTQQRFMLQALGGRRPTRRDPRSQPMAPLCGGFLLSLHVLTPQSWPSRHARTLFPGI